MRTPRLTWMTLWTPLLCLAGCLQAEAVPLADAGPNVHEDAAEPDMGALDPSASWPALAYDGQREMFELYPCESALLWTFRATRDALGNRRNDEEVWAWEVGGTPQILAANLRPNYRRLAGCYEGAAYWTESDGTTPSLYRRSTSADSPAEFVRAGGAWSMGEEGRLTRWIEGDAGVEVFDLDDSSMTIFSFDGLAGSQQWRATRATRDHVYVTGDPAARIAFTAGAEWVPVGGAGFDSVFESPSGRVVASDTETDARITQIGVDGTALTLALSCETRTAIPIASGRGGWVLWNFATSASGCLEVGRSAVDENGNVRVQVLPDITRLAKEMSRETNSGWEISIRVVQFGAQIAFVDLLAGTIRLADEPPFLCIDPTLPCPEGAQCATTRCADLPN